MALQAAEKIAREQRSFGANIVVEPVAAAAPGGAPAGAAALLEADLARVLTIFWRHNVIGLAPSLTAPATASGPADPVVFAQVFRGREKVFERRMRAGERVSYPGGELALEPEVLLWVELLAVRDRFLPLAAAGLVLAAVGLALRGGLALAAALRRAPAA